MSFAFIFFFKQKTAYEMRISDWNSDVCSSELDLRALGANGVDREAEGEPHRIVRDGLQERDHLARVDEGEGPGEDIDTAATSAGTRHLEIGDVGRLLREARPVIAETGIARRLSFELARPGDIGRSAHVVHETVHAVADVCGDGGRDHAGGSYGERRIADASNHVRLPSR